MINLEKLKNKLNNYKSLTCAYDFSSSSSLRIYSDNWILTINNDGNLVIVDYVVHSNKFVSLDDIYKFIINKIEQEEVNVNIEIDKTEI